MKRVSLPKWIAAAGLLALQISMVGCGKFSPNSTDLGRIKTTSDRPVDSDDAYIQSQNLTDEAETIMDPDSFDRASDKLNEALKVDPTNFRAKFYLETMKPVLAAKGYFARVRPFYMSLPNGENRYATMVDGAMKNFKSGYRHFFLSGPEDIHSVEELQEFFDTMILSLEDLRHFLRANKSEELRLRRVPFLFSELTEGFRDQTEQQCSDGKFGPLTIDLGFCGTNREVTLGHADFEVLQLGIAAYEGYFAVMNAYTINPKLVNYMYDQQDDHDARVLSTRGHYGSNGEWIQPTNPQSIDLSPEEKAKVTTQTLNLLTEAGFGHLRKTQKISSFEEVAQGVKIALFYYIENQSSLCRDGYMTTRNRPGFLFETGFCQRPPADVDEEHPEPGESAARVLESALLGQSITPELIHQHSPKPWALNALLVLRQPPENLTVIQPPTSKSCRFVDISVDDAKLAKYMTRGTVTDVINAGDMRCNQVTP